VPSLRAGTPSSSCAGCIWLALALPTGHELRS
jgi:hypothetical protein